MWETNHTLRLLVPEDMIAFLVRADNGMERFKLGGYYRFVTEGGMLVTSGMKMIAEQAIIGKIKSPRLTRTHLKDVSKIYLKPSTYRRMVMRLEEKNRETLVPSHS